MDKEIVLAGNAVSKVSVTGPMKFTARDGDVECPFCGVVVPKGNDLFVGRVAGKHVRVCSDDCFKGTVKAASGE